MAETAWSRKAALTSQGGLWERLAGTNGYVGASASYGGGGEAVGAEGWMGLSRDGSGFYDSLERGSSRDVALLEARGKDPWCWH